MDTYHGTLYRTSSDDKQTLGTLSIFCGDELVYQCKTLELAWRDNKAFKSCIPCGKYRVKARQSATYGDHWHIQDVCGRDLILIHHGNYHRDTEGCVMVGQSFADINADGYRDVIRSKATMRAINNAIRSTYWDLEVIER